VRQARTEGRAEAEAAAEERAAASLARAELDLRAELDKQVCGSVCTCNSLVGGQLQRARRTAGPSAAAPHGAARWHRAVGTCTARSERA